MRVMNSKEQAQDRAGSRATMPSASRIDDAWRPDRGPAQAAAPSRGSLMADAPRMVAQRRAIEALSGSTIQLTKTKHNVGDLHYGMTDPRDGGYDEIDEATPDSKVDGPENPGTVDELNDQASISKMLDGPDTTKGYFNAMAMIGSYTLPSPPSIPKKWERWLDFLKREQAYLKLDGLVTQIQSTTAPSSPSKDKLNKNASAPTGGQSVQGKRDAIVAAYTAKATAAAPSAYHDLVNGWIMDAFFRRTSKLGIKFTVEEGKVVHFNMDAPGNKSKSRPDSTVNAAAELNLPGRQPITHSEIRYVHREGLFESPHMDIYGDELEVNEPRTGDEGKMPNYLARRSGKS